MGDRKRILTTAALLMACLAAVVTATGIVVTHRAALTERRAELRSLALREVQVIEAILGHDSTDHDPADHLDPTSIVKCPKCSAKTALVMHLLRESGNFQSGWGEGVEFVVGRRKADTIRFLLRSKHADEDDINGAMEVPWKSELAAPMRLALSGLSGITEAEDYRGEIVLAAYAPVKLLGWGVVAKIDKTEMHAPFVTAAKTSIMIAVLAILVGLIVLRMRLNPLIQRSHDNETQALKAVAELKNQQFAMNEHSIIAITDPSGKITHANEKFCQVSQYSREELMGQDHRMVNSGHHPREFFAEMWKTIAGGEVWQGEVCNRAKDGTLYWMETTIVPFKNDAGRVTQFVAIRTEITERKRAEQSFVRFRSALDCSADGVFLIDRASMRFIDVNDTACESVGYSREELLSMGPQDIKPLLTREQLEREFDEITAGGNGFGVVETVHRRKDGSRFPVEVFLKMVAGEASPVLVAMARDVSERKRVERQLIAAREDADVANKAKSDFLANMSHEIRTPMTAILGFAENMLDVEQSDSQKLNCVHTIRRNGEYLLALINDILDLSKIEAGKMAVECRDFQPCRIMAEVVSLMRVRADAKGLPFNIEYVGAIPETIKSDPTRLRQILINLIGNAIKFTETGTVRLVIRFVDRDDPPCLQFDVIDTGRGMTQEQLGKLFQPFMQADNSTTREFGGTGLGLTISKRFAELLGGDITVVETELGVGSTFRVNVATGPLDGVAMLDDPMSATVVAHDTNGIPQAPRSDLEGRRILLAEDGPDNQRLISFVLNKAGADVTVEENGKLALDAALAARDAGNPFDVILMDMQMPVMDGYEATGQLRRKDYTGPIIALTAHAMAGDREKCHKAGCDDYATKPIDRAKLVETIQRNLVPAETASPVPK